jgi:prophage DNA circulation protein
MFNAVDAVFNNYASIYEGKEALNEAIARFRSTKSGIENIATDLSVKTTGATVDKNNAKTELINALHVASSQGVAYAAKMNKQDMRVRLKFVKVQLLGSNDEEIEKRAASNINILKEELPNMRAYDITEAELDDLNEKLSNFRKSIGNKTIIKTSSSVGKKSLSELYYTASSILADEIDFLMKKYASSQAEFYKAYRIARRIADLGGSKTSNTPSTPEIGK